MPELSPDEMGGDLWAKQAPSRSHAVDTFNFPDAGTDGTSVAESAKPAKKATKKKG